MTIKIGDVFPNMLISVKHENEWKKIETYQLFNKKRTVLFGAPGAFTPVCTQIHAAGIVKYYDELLSLGIDQIALLTVNDRYVMDAWAEKLNFPKSLLIIADASAALTCAIGLQYHLEENDLGLRSKRYSMILNDKTVEAFYLENSLGECKISSAEVLLKNAYFHVR